MDLPIFEQVLGISLESVVSHFQDIAAMAILQGLTPSPSTVRIEVPPASICRMLSKTELRVTCRSLCYPGGDGVSSSIKGRELDTIMAFFRFFAIGSKKPKKSEYWMILIKRGRY